MLGGGVPPFPTGGDALASPLGSPHLYPPAAPELRDILAAGGMRNARDDASSVGADAGTDAGSIAGFGGAWGGGGDDGVSGSEGEGDAPSGAEGAGSAGGAGDAAGAALGLGLGLGVPPPGTTDAAISDDRQEALDMFMSVTQESREKAAQFLGATDWRIDAALNLFMESGGEGAPAPAPPGVGRGGGGGGGGGGAGDGRAGASSGSRRMGAPRRSSRLATGGAGAGGGARGLAGGERVGGSEVIIHVWPDVSQCCCSIFGVPGDQKC